MTKLRTERYLTLSGIHDFVLFKTAEEIEQEIADIKNALFDFDTENAEEFCSQISQIEDKKQLLALKKPCKPCSPPASPPAPRGHNVAVRAGIEDAVSGVGEEVIEGVGGVDVITFYLEISFK